VPELRFDPLGRRHVLLAPERARRGAPVVEPSPPDPDPCDFCGGSEDRTPPETYSIREPQTKPDTPGWRVRVVPNLYPATEVHEVVVHTPDHFTEFEELELAHRTDVLRAYRARITDASTQATVIVWNRGKAAGASRTHAHGQLFGLDSTPPTLERETTSFGEDQCVLCQLSENSDVLISDVRGFRLTAHTVPFVADEVLVVPPCTPRFDALDDEGLERAAEAFAAAVRLSMRSLGPAVAFNFVIHTAPRGIERFHWHAHLMPRTAVWGGLEMGAELPIVAADPYETARRLRES
jgi:UDPglucose--hexose-1-phosphate uridylyltransferase